MQTFSGFPSGKVGSASIPEQVFTEIVPIVDDLAELKLTLHVLWRLGQQRGKVRYLRRADVSSDRVLLSGLGRAPAEALSGALERAVERGTLLQVETTIAGASETVYFANTPKGRAAVKAIERGGWPDELESAARPNVFALYEANVGLLTPLIADELREAEQEYPAEWIEDAFREAVSLNKRSWKYIRAILERWRTEGRDDGRRTPEASRRRYIEGKYGDYIEH
ncbi:MAG: primosomal replication protein N [Chloroflexi bacterium]|nr:MAG: primosomal replication protein N [Chloroflexota bacterium]